MADEPAVRRRRSKRRRRAIAIGAGLAVTVAAAGTAWAATRPDDPSYRLATVQRADVEQTVDADGALAAQHRSALSFAVSGTVAAVKVAVGDTVAAGQAVATMDPQSLDASVAAAQADLAQATQTLADDESGQSSGQSSSSDAGQSRDTGGVTANAVSTIRLTSWTSPGTASSGGQLSTAQAAVVAAQHKLDAAIATQDAAVSSLVASCAAAPDSKPATASVVAADDGTVTGDVGSARATVTLRSTDGDVAVTSSADPQTIAAGGSYSFAGLTAGTKYRVEIVRTAAVDTDACSTSVTRVSTAQRDVDTASSRLDAALADLTKAIGSTDSTGTGRSGGTTTTTPTKPTESTKPTTPTSSRQGTRSATSTPAAADPATTTTPVTAEQIAADAKTIDAMQAAVTLAQHQRTYATLTSSIAGTVAAVDLAPGDTVGASSTTSTITVVGKGTLSVVVDIGIADIDLVKPGRPVAVTVDGRTAPLPGHVALVGTTNASSSTGSSSAYPVTVSLDAADSTLYDGMGASLSIDVGTVRNVLTVPVSAVSTIGKLHTVRRYANGTVTATPVTVGLEGGDLAQVESGVQAGDRVVIADLGAAVPTSGDTGRRGTGGSLTGGLTGSVVPGGAGGGPPGRGGR